MQRPPDAIVRRGAPAGGAPSIQSSISGNGENRSNGLPSSIEWPPPCTAEPPAETEGPR